MLANGYERANGDSNAYTRGIRDKAPRRTEREEYSSAARKAGRHSRVKRIRNAKPSLRGVSGNTGREEADERARTETGTMKTGEAKEEERRRGGVIRTRSRKRGRWSVRARVVTRARGAILVPAPAKGNANVVPETEILK